VPNKWHTVREVADMLGYGLSKTKMFIAMGEIRSLKDGKSPASYPNGLTSMSPARPPMSRRRPSHDRTPHAGQR
jgi:hypothetical protein